MTRSKIKWLFVIAMLYIFAFVQAQDRGEETVTFDFGCPKIKHKVIGMILKDGIPFNDNRTDIGVGEEVLLEIDSKFGSVTWTVTPSSAGLIVPKSTSKIEFHAGLDAVKAVIRAVPSKTCSSSPYIEITFNVVAPTLNYPLYCNMHLLNLFDAGIYTRVSLLPDNVSFHNISTFEKDCFPVTTGIFSSSKFNTLSHNSSPVGLDIMRLCL